ncbi:MAG: hypothetical protein KDA05_12785 [Phycisphaerales bacterium]|nr:hypothetical protein [Phycisphaerales bacterium]
MNRKMGLLVACGLAASLGGVASAQTDASRALSADIAADAASRMSYQGGSEGFAVPSSTGNSTLNIGGLVSFRTNFNFGDDDRGEDNDFVWGFALPHEQIWFYGNLFNPDFTYMIEAEFEGVNSSDGGIGTSGSGDFNLRDAWGRYQFENGAYVQAGQFKVDYSAETLTEDQYLLFAERSFVDEYFSADYTQGVRVGYEGDTFHIVGDVYDGPWGRNLDWTDPAEADFAIGGRFDWLFSGQWVFDDQTSWRGSEFSGRLGGAVHWATYGETGFGSPADVDIIYYTVDVGVEGDGWNAFAAFLGDHIDADGADEVDNFGFVVQGGIFITDNTELAARVDFLFRDDDAFSGDEDQYFLTVGVNHYFFAESHAATAYANLVWGFQDTGDLIGSDMHYRGNTANGLLGNDDDEVALIFGFDALF